MCDVVVIHSSANIRAAEYKIKTVERLQSKLIAGKIIPAIVTTTAAVTGTSLNRSRSPFRFSILISPFLDDDCTFSIGLVCLELYKLLQNKKLEQYRNTFINLALPVFQQSDPVAPKKAKFGDVDVNLWTRIDIKLGDVTLGEVRSGVLFALFSNWQVVGMWCCRWFSI
jgi:ubiquitin-activating enzyme E1